MSLILLLSALCRGGSKAQKGNLLRFTYVHAYAEEIEHDLKDSEYLVDGQKKRERAFLLEQGNRE